MKGESRMSTKLECTYDIYIGAPIGKVWKGLVDGDLTRQYVYGTRFQSKLTSGSRYAYLGDGDFRVVDGRILEVRVVHDDFDGPTATYKESIAGWPVLMSSLKTLLETGKPLEMKP
jgi:hypothetical protein